MPKHQPVDIPNMLLGFARRLLVRARRRTNCGCARLPYTGPEGRFPLRRGNCDRAKSVDLRLFSEGDFDGGGPAGELVSRWDIDLSSVHWVDMDFYPEADDGNAIVDPAPVVVVNAHLAPSRKLATCTIVQWCGYTEELVFGYDDLSAADIGAIAARKESIHPRDPFDLYLPRGWKPKGERGS